MTAIAYDAPVAYDSSDYTYDGEPIVQPTVLHLRRVGPARAVWTVSGPRRVPQSPDAGAPVADLTAGPPTI
jgi:hypothetical protein